MSTPTREEIRGLVLDRLLHHGGGDREALQSAKDVDMTRDVAVDSLHMVEVVLELEEKLGVNVPHSEMTSTRMRSVNEFADYLHGKAASKSRTELTTAA